MGGPAVAGFDEQHAQPMDLDRWVRLAERVLDHEGASRGELTLLFVDEAAIAELNAAHMGEPGPTDVLSFPIDAAPSDTTGSDVPVLLGDVVVCPVVAQRNAAERGVTLDDELALLVVHGVLHVLGHDHAAEAEATAMQARERMLLERFNRA